MNKVLISIIIPVFNVEKYLERCINSLIHQTYKYIEIILVNDGSTDYSGDICNKYANLDKRITVIHQSNMGRVKARKIGFDKSHGEYVTFVDADDWVEVNTYKEVITYIKFNDIDIISYGLVEEFQEYKITRMNKIKENIYIGEELKDLYKKIICKDTFFEWMVSPSLCNKIFKRELLKKSIFNTMDERITYGEDFLINLSCYLNMEKILFLDICPYHYAQNNYINGFENIVVSDISVKCLYKSINEIIENSVYKEYFRDQLNLYFWFILLLRKYEKISSNEFLFPIEDIKKNSRIILYGAGEFGISVCKYIKKSNAFKLNGWVDKNYNTASKKKMYVEQVNSIKDKSYDFIFISILNEKIAKKIVCELCELGIDRRKIIYISGQNLINRKLPEWLLR
ncbi:glycosyltransferase [Clostridium butyricum]|uniref:glycosyltransferase family 2 protein n=1 Tax=Clostridium butyricum TaxID=1492 RepID=UPI001CA9A9F4|nr:glycosyltransferase family 2 protein [Clostridium butyricum]MBZ0312897.1 glycosyltransferase [Clostridium butyricum]